MRRRQWSGQEKFNIVLEGLSGQIDIESLCTKYKLSQRQYYRWRDQLLKFGHQAFERHTSIKEEMRLREDHKKLKHILGELMLELKDINNRSKN